MTKYILVPLSTEVIEANPNYPLEGATEQGKLVITVDTRGEDVQARLGIPPETHLYWGKSYQFFVQELSSLGYPVCYRILAREGY